MKKTLFNMYNRKYITSAFFILIISTIIITNFTINILITNSPFITKAIQNPRELYWMIGWHIEQTPSPITIEKFFSSVQTGIQRFKYSKGIGDSEGIRINDRNFYITLVLVDFYGYIQKVLGKQVCGDVLKLNNGHLTAMDEAIVKEQISESEITNRIRLINKLSKVTQTYDTPFLYISFPHKIHKKDSQLPFPSNDINDFADCFCKQFEDIISHNINAQLYDARNLYLNNPKEHYRLFYKSSHHWQPEYAFYVFLDILKYFDKSKFNIPEEISNSQNYEFAKFPFTLESPDGIGVYERRTGPLYFTNNDFTYFPIPKYPVLFEVTVPSDSYYQKNNFKDSIYLYSNQPLRTIINPNQSRGKILLIKDSFALPLFYYLGLISHQVDMIDLRHYNGSIFDYIKDNRPDIVIIAYHPRMLYKKHRIMFEFDKQHEDSKPYTAP